MNKFTSISKFLSVFLVYLGKEPVLRRMYKSFLFISGKIISGKDNLSQTAVCGVNKYELEERISSRVPCNGLILMNTPPELE